MSNLRQLIMIPPPPKKEMPPYDKAQTTTLIAKASMPEQCSGGARTRCSFSRSGPLFVLSCHNNGLSEQKRLCLRGSLFGLMPLIRPVLCLQPRSTLVF